MTETLTYSDFLRHPKKDSVLIPGLTVWDDEIFSCPRCNHEIKGGLRHGIAVMCPKCRLDMVVYGNSLQIEGVARSEPHTESPPRVRKEERPTWLPFVFLPVFSLLFVGSIVGLVFLLEWLTGG